MSSRNVKIFLLISLCLFAKVAFCQDTAVQPISGCHCFNERAFNPADRFAADPYILATTFNSLLSRSFDLPKRDIVMLKMRGGVGQHDLLIALEAAKASGTELKRLLGFRAEKISWQKILSELLPSDNFKNAPVLQEIQSGLSEAAAAQKIAERLLVAFFQIPEKVVMDLRASGLNEKEMALLLIVAQAGKLPQEDGARQRIQEGKSWSEIAHQQGIEPAEAGRLIIDHPKTKLKK